MASKLTSAINTVSKLGSASIYPKKTTAPVATTPKPTVGSALGKSIGIGASTAVPSGPITPTQTDATKQLTQDDVNTQIAAALSKITPQTPVYQAPALPDTTALRQQILEQARARLGIQKTAQNEAIRTSAEQSKKDIQSAYLQGKQGELERLVNQGLATGMQGAEQSGQARNEILQRQLASENQSRAVDVQAQADITALDRQYNELLAQGDIEGAKQAIDDAWQRYNAQTQAGQFGANFGQQVAQTAQQQSQFEASQASAQADREYQKQQDAIQLAYRAEQDAIANALNNKQLTFQQAQEKRRILEADRDYKLNAAQVAYQTRKPYYKATTTKKDSTASKEAQVNKEGL